MKDIFDIFDSWEPLMKARKAKGLSQWDRLKNISEKLQGKNIKAISFTCAHPSHVGEPVRHLLGSIEGNLHFLLGYGNPSFHIAPYVWQCIDPNVTDEEAEEMSKRMSHPSNPVLWSKSGLDVGDEGDLEEGKPHELHTKAKQKASKDASRKSEEVKVKSPTGSYTCYPTEGLVYGDHNDHVYTWDLVKDSFFTAQNPQIVEVMEAAGVQKSFGVSKCVSGIPSKVTAYTAQFRGESYDTDVWPLVKSRLPVPGKVLKLESTRGETIYGVTTPTELRFFTREATPAEVQVFDRTYSSFDLTKSGNVPPAALLGFIAKHFRIDQNLLGSIANAVNPDMKVIQILYGEPSLGWDDFPATGTP